jgi:tellurite resistance protein TerC
VSIVSKIRKIVITIIGFSVIAIGCALIFLPGPAFIIIPIGIAILSIEFKWAKKLLTKVKEKLGKKYKTSQEE